MKRLRFRSSVAATLQLLFVVGCSGIIDGIAERFTGEDVASKIRSTGSPAKATVVAIWETGTRVNHNPVVGFDVEVHAEGRPAWRAKTKALVSILAIPRIQPGAVLDVFYDPADPSRVAIAKNPPE